MSDITKDFSDAKNESKIQEKDLLEEIYLAISELFVGEMALTDGAILYSPLNGQKFRIQVFENL